MKKLKFYITISFLFIISTYSYSHLEIFSLSDGHFEQENKKISSNYSFTLNIKEKIFIDQIGIDFFDVGNDGKGKIQVKIYQDNQLIINKSNIILDVYGQIAYIDINALFFENKNYVFNLILIDNDESNKDNLIRIFKPNKIPLELKENPFITNEINSSEDSIYPFNKSLFCPFIHIGTTNQKGIDFSVLVEKQEFEEKNKLVNRSTIFTVENMDLGINKIGLNYFESGLDNKSNLILKLDDLTDNTSIKIDTVIYNHHKKPLLFSKKTTLFKNHTYSLSLMLNNENNLDDMLVLYKPDKIPYRDNLNKIEIINLLNDQNNDSLGVPFTLDFEDLNSTINLEVKNVNQKTITINNQLFSYNETKKIKTIHFYDFTGRELSKIDIADNNFENNIIIENKMDFSLIQIIFEDLFTTNFISLNQGN